MVRRRLWLTCCRIDIVCLVPKLLNEYSTIISSGILSGVSITYTIYISDLTNENGIKSAKSSGSVSSFHNQKSKLRTEYMSQNMLDDLYCYYEHDKKI